MTKLILTPAEEAEIMRAVKEMDYRKTDMIFEELNSFIKSKYNICQYVGCKISFDEFSSDCNEVIIDCFSTCRGNTYDVLISYIKSILSKRVNTIIKKYNTKNNNYVLVEYIDFFHSIETSETELSQRHILSKIAFDSYYCQYGYERITKYEVEVLKEYIYKGDLRIFANKRGIQHKSVMRTLSRASQKIKDILNSLGISKENYKHLLYHS